MHKITLVFALLFVLLGTVATNAQQAVAERTVSPLTNAQYFQGRLERLYKAIDAKETGKIAQYESDLLAAIRENINLASETKDADEKQTFATRKVEILNNFESFSFANAPKDESDTHLALLEEFLGMLLAK
jgi:hypothetical protein